MSLDINSRAGKGCEPSDLIALAEQGRGSAAPKVPMVTPGPADCLRTDAEGTNHYVAMTPVGKMTPAHGMTLCPRRVVHPFVEVKETLFMASTTFCFNKVTLPSGQPVGEQ